MLCMFCEVAQASCGATFCSLNTMWNTQDTATDAGTGKIDLRYEFIKQDRLRSGNTNISQAQDTNDTTELKTLNRNLIATLDYAFNSQWGFSVSIPVVSRSHSHISEPTGAATHESWDFLKVGDVRLLGRYQYNSDTSSAAHYGVQFGVKLPSGDFHVANSEGVIAERSLQPGTGSVDAIFGGYYAYRADHNAPTWFAQTLFQRAIWPRDNFKPGDQLSLTGGITFPYTDTVSLLFQLNGLIKQHDTGANAEPDLSGGRYLHASPGLSYAFTRGTQLYGFLQLPVYQHVNGTQLVSDGSLVVGLATKF